MAGIVSDQWWQENRPAKWKGTGIGKYLRTFEENDKDVTRSGERLDVNTRLSDATATSARAAKEAAQAALDTLRTWMAKGNLATDEQNNMARLEGQLQLVVSQYKYA